MARLRVQHEVTSAPESSDDEEQQDLSSEGEEEVNMIKVGEQMLQASRRRRDSRRKLIENEHKKRVKDAKTKINELYDERKDRVQKLQRSQWERLSTLLQKRKAIEVRIFGHLKTLEATRSNLASILDAVCVGRQDEIAELGQVSKD